MASGSVLASEATAFVTLKGGLVVPLEALQLAWSLENRGAVLATEGAELLVDTPPDLLTKADRMAIRRWRAHLMAIATYEAPAGERFQ